MFKTLSQTALLRRFLKNAGGYGLGSLVVRVGGLAIWPLFWANMGPEEFGKIGISQVLTVLLAPLFGLGLSHVVQRFYFEWAPDQRPRILAGLWIVSLSFSLIVITILELFGGRVFGAALRSVPFNPYLRLSLWASFFSSLSLLPLTLLRLREEIRRYNQCTVISFLMQISCSLYFVVGHNAGATGYLLGILVSQGLWGVFYVGLMFKEVSFPADFHRVRRLLGYALPFVPTAILDGVMTILDRFLLDKWMPLDQIGLYTVASQFGNGVSALHNLLKVAWQPFIFRVVSTRSDAPKVLSDFSIYYMAAMSIPALAVAVLSADFIRWTANASYFAAVSLIPYFAFAHWVQGMGETMGRGIDFSNRTVFNPLGPLAAIVCGSVAMGSLVPKFGVTGAALAFGCTVLVRSLVQSFIAKYFYPRPSVFWRLSSLMLLMALCYLLIGAVRFDVPYFESLFRSIAVIFYAVLIVLIYVNPWKKAAKA